MSKKNGFFSSLFSGKKSNGCCQMEIVEETEENCGCSCAEGQGSNYTSNHAGCCSGGSECCPPEHEKKQILIDFLYLDLSVCERCQGAENNLDKAIDEVAEVLKAAGFEIVVNKININSKKLAIEHQFLSSPTIRVNGGDIALEVKETPCKECGDLCGDSAVDCRVWVYEGVEYTEPPKSMIVNAILKEVYGESKVNFSKDVKYEIPKNLITFFEGFDKRGD